MLNETREKYTYDPETGDFHRKSDGKRVTEKNTKGYVRLHLSRRRIAAHRIVFLLMTGKLPTGQVDHINRIRDDNRWCNLREATNAQNRINSELISGVYRYYRKWRAEIQRDGKRYRLGAFASEETARGAYRAAVKVLYGEFAPSIGQEREGEVTGE